MKTSEIMSAMIFGDGGASKVEELSTDGGSTDAGKVLTVGSDGRIAPIDLPVGEGQIALDGTLTIHGAAAGAKETGDAIRALNGSLEDNLNSMVIADQYDPFTSWEGGAYKYSEAGYPLEKSTASALNKTRKRSLRETISGHLILTAKEGYSFRVYLCDSSSIIVSVTDFIKSFDKYCGYKTTVVVKSDSDADISATDIGDIITAQYYPSKVEKIYQYDIPFDRGSILSNNGALSNSDIVNLPVYRRSAYPYKVKPGSRIEISLPETFDSARVFYYRDTGAFLSYVQLTIAPTVRLLVPSNAHYFMLSGASSADIDYVLTLKSEYPIRRVGNFRLNLNATTYKSIAFPYKVSGDVYTSGRLMLPPNYTPDGKNVPLIVFCHGGNGIKTWTSNMFTVGSHSYKAYYDYLNNEGFAVFDCYPWTTKYDSIGSGVNTTYALAHCKRAYIEGVKYVCDRFNIDADRVCMIAKSQGGHIGHWASVQAEFPFKAIALYAPSVTLFNPITKQMLFDTSVRTAISQIIDFDGTEEQKSTFKENGLYTNETVLSFIALNRNKFAGLTPALHGVHGDTYEIMFEYSKDTVDVLPAWMDGLPALTYEHSELINHPEYSKHALCPVKFWCAFDDENTSSYVNYAVYQWMKNGGSDVQYRILPDGTGGHYAMDADTHALKSSGTTALGIEYTNMPTAYVETVAFFREKLAM